MQASQIVFIANCAPAGQQPSAEAELFASVCRVSLVKCHDCGEKFPAAQLDISTLLCEECYDRAGDENALQDGLITEAEFLDRWGA